MQLKARLFRGIALAATVTMFLSPMGCSWPEFSPRSALPRPEALDRDRVKRHFRTWDIKDPVAMERLAEAADSLAAFRIAFYCAPSTCPRPLREPLETLIAPGADSRLRRLQLSEQAKKASSGLNIGYGFIAIGTNRLAFLADASFIADPLANYTDGFVFERQPSGKWQFVCHLTRIFHEHEVGGLVLARVVRGERSLQTTEGGRCQSVRKTGLTSAAWVVASSRRTSAAET